MIYSLALPCFRRANVWLDEAPNANFAASSTIVRTLHPKKMCKTTYRVAVVELNIPQGPRTAYALLGAELVSSNDQDLEVSISIKSEGSPYVSSLVPESDEVAVGLPDEYATAIFSGAERIVVTIGAPAKVALQFHWAAHGRVGSSPWLFEKVSALVTQLLMLPKDSTKQQVEAVFE